ncbi:MAG: hypothetical protein AAFS07_11245 [Pseudomonadota bacterium]
MDLGVQTHFGQDWHDRLIPAIERIEADHTRDAVYWARVERAPGVIQFEGFDTSHPAVVSARGIETRLVFNERNPIYEDGNTVQSAPGLAAFADYVARTVAQFPSVTTVEIGNEVNGTFVRGPLEAAGPVERAKAHARIVAAVAAKLRETAPEIRVLGGAAHSIPLVYLKPMVEAGILADIDALVVHPYSSPPAHVGEHLAIARSALGAPDLAIHATEFGQEGLSPAEAADYLVRMATALAAGGVESATWYALVEQQRYPGMGLVERDGRERPAAAAFRLMQRLLDLGTPVPVTLGPSMRAYDFAGRALVIWGLPRAVADRAGLTWVTATGAPIDVPAFTAEAPVIALAPEPVDFAAMVELEDIGVASDSYFDFSLTTQTPWRRAMRDGAGEEAPLTIQGGGARGTAWRPYLGDGSLNPLGIAEHSARPVVFDKPSGPAAFGLVETVDLRALSGRAVCAHFEHRGKRSGDGVTIQLTVDGVAVRRQILRQGETASWRVETPGAATARLSIDPNGTGVGDLVARHLAVLSDPAAACPPPVLPR